MLSSPSFALIYTDNDNVQKDVFEDNKFTCFHSLYYCLKIYSMNNI